MIACLSLTHYLYYMQYSLNFLRDFDKAFIIIKIYLYEKFTFSVNVVLMNSTKIDLPTLK